LLFNLAICLKLTPLIFEAQTTGLSPQPNAPIFFSGLLLAPLDI